MPHGSHTLLRIAAGTDANLRHRPPDFGDLAGHRRLVIGPSGRVDEDRPERRHLP